MNMLLCSDQKDILSESADIVQCCIDTIERVGGGGIRCMMTGIFADRKWRKPEWISTYIFLFQILAKKLKNIICLTFVIEKSMKYIITV